MKTQANERHRFMTTEEVADLLRVTREAITIQVRKGRLPAVRFGRRWLIRPEDVEAMLAAGRDQLLTEQEGQV